MDQVISELDTLQEIKWFGNAVLEVVTVVTIVLSGSYECLEGRCVELLGWQWHILSCYAPTFSATSSLTIFKRLFFSLSVC